MIVLALPVAASPRKPSVPPKPPPAARKPVDVVLPIGAAPAAWLTGLPEADRPPKDAKLAAALPVGPLAPITSVRFSPDGHWLLAASDGRVVVWDARTGAAAGELPGIQGMVHTLAFSPDGKWLAAGGGTPTVAGRVALFGAGDLTKPPVAVLTGHHDVVYRLAFSPDGKQLATASLDRTAQVWDLATRKPVATLTGHSEALDAVAFTPDGHGVLTGSMDHAARLWDVKTSKTERAFSGSQGGILSLQVAPDGKRLLAGEEDGEIRWWNLADAKPVRTSGGHHGEVADLVFSHDGKLLASAGADGTARVRDGATGETRTTLTASPEPLYAVDFSPGGQFVAAAGWDGILRIWDTKAGKLRLSLVAAPPAWSSAFRVPRSGLGHDRTPAPLLGDGRTANLHGLRMHHPGKGVRNSELGTQNPELRPPVRWLAITPAGYLDGSPEMLRRLQFRLGTAPAPAAAGIEAALHQRSEVATALRP